jgi:hypothetical protein
MPTYLIHDNGGRPFQVKIDGKSVSVWKKDKSDPDDDETYSKLIENFKVKDMIIGKSSGKTKACDHTKAQAKKFDGNSILLHLKGDEYVYIGHEIYWFEMKDELEGYYSPVGPNDVPYPLVLGKENVYFMLDKKYASREQFPTGQIWEEAYTPYYGTFTPEKGWQTDIKSKKFKTKQIHKRVWP